MDNMVNNTYWREGWYGGYELVDKETGMVVRVEF